MTEALWLSSADPWQLWHFADDHRKLSDRKLRLYAAACCRRVWDRMEDERSRRAVVVAERFADGLASEADLNASSEEAWENWVEDHKKVGFDLDAANHLLPFPSGAACNVAVLEMGCWGAAPAYWAPDDLIREAATDPAAEGAAQSALVRDIVGNPFRPVTIDPCWLTTSVVGLALAIYIERAFDRLPRLADDLQAVGCQSEEILAHCQGDGPHVPGCWVLDLILGKE